MRENRRARIRKIIRGTEKCPRLVVFRSNKYVSAQLIDDSKGHTLVSVNKATDSVIVGQEIAEKAMKLKVEKIVFDRAGYRYHGNIKKLADAAREKGLKF